MLCLKPKGQQTVGCRIQLQLIFFYHYRLIGQLFSQLISHLVHKMSLTVTKPKITSELTAE